MEHKKPYTKPELEELGRVHDVTGGGLFDIGDVLSSLLGGHGKPGRPGKPTGSH